MVLETFPDFGVTALGHAELMLAGPHGLAFLFLHFHELLRLGVADGALGRSVLTFIHIAANEAAEFLFHINIL